jgi:hypothetical protein
MNDELSVIREYIESMPRKSITDKASQSKALAALSRLEARAAEMPDAASLANSIRFDDFDTNSAAALIGQYAYRYSEDIRKDRDAWRSLAADYAGAVSKMMGQ